jgi:hypothetical protein
VRLHRLAAKVVAAVEAGVFPPRCWAWGRTRPRAAVRAGAALTHGVSIRGRWRARLDSDRLREVSSRRRSGGPPRRGMTRALGRWHGSAVSRGPDLPTPPARADGALPDHRGYHGVLAPRARWRPRSWAMVGRHPRPPSFAPPRPAGSPRPHFGTGRGQLSCDERLRSTCWPAQTVGGGSAWSPRSRTRSRCATSSPPNG